MTIIERTITAWWEVGGLGPSGQDLCYVELEKERITCSSRAEPGPVRSLPYLAAEPPHRRLPSSHISIFENSARVLCKVTSHAKS